ncbi:hypothetical protein MYP_1484 [Sporocytophaga myxococcoides]|uniref:Uncharacterized protein n=1 Tax=Sporocytophaga myxococcoides TaxID=153721 RepID=A0A098LBI7_9BACT|nr:hypothetical protein MYP_1484 [Sporocytophaga myxococcoides]
MFFYFDGCPVKNFSPKGLVRKVGYHLKLLHDIQVVLFSDHSVSCKLLYVLKFWKWILYKQSE